MTLKHIHLSSVSDLGPSFYIGWLTHLHKNPFPAAPLFCILVLPLSLSESLLTLFEFSYSLKIHFGKFPIHVSSCPLPPATSSLYSTASPHLLSLPVTSSPLFQIHRATWSPPIIFSFFTYPYFQLYLFGTPKSQVFWFFKVNSYICFLFSLRLWHLNFNLLIIDNKY